MAYTPGGLSLMSHSNGFAFYRYDSLDANTAVDIDGYFNNNDDTLQLRAGDLILVVDWDTAVGPGGTIAGWGHHMVMAVDAAGAVDLAEADAGNVTNID